MQPLEYVVSECATTVTSLIITKKSLKEISSGVAGMSIAIGRAYDLSSNMAQKMIHDQVGILLKKKELINDD